MRLIIVDCRSARTARLHWFNRSVWVNWCHGRHRSTWYSRLEGRQRRYGRNWYVYMLTNSALIKTILGNRLFINSFCYLDVPVFPFFINSVVTVQCFYAVGWAAIRRSSLADLWTRATPGKTRRGQM